MEFVDDRTEEQKKTHPYIFGGTDSFMSGWGGAEGGSSYAFWACTQEDWSYCKSYVLNRGDLKRVRQVSNDYKPNARNCAHCHVYIYDGQGLSEWGLETRAQVLADRKAEKNASNITS